MPVCVIYPPLCTTFDRCAIQKPSRSATDTKSVYSTFSFFVVNIGGIISYGCVGIVQQTEQCTVLASTIVAQGIVVGSTLILSLLGFSLYFVRLFPEISDDPLLADDASTVSTTEKTYINAGGRAYHYSTFHTDALLRDPTT